jgi:DNA polymerase I
VVEVARSVLAFRKAEKLAGTYLEGFARMADADGLLHAQLNTLAARTGRMSIREPALQTLPKPNDDPQSRLVRKAVIPRNEGEVLISADWAQIEGRIAAHVSGDTNLIAAFNTADETGGDFFVEMGKLIYKDPGFTKKDDRRKIVKGVIYGLLYGAGAPKMAETAGIPEHEAVEARSAILGTFPGLNAAMKRFEREGSTGYVTTHYGRQLEVDEGKAYTGLNTYIQGTAADCLKNALVLLANAGLDQAMVVPVHDEVVVSVPASDAEEVEHLLVETMRINDFDVGVPAESSGPMLRWADDAS